MGMLITHACHHLTWCALGFSVLLTHHLHHFVHFVLQVPKVVGTDNNIIYDVPDALVNDSRNFTVSTVLDTSSLHSTYTYSFRVSHVRRSDMQK